MSKRDDIARRFRVLRILILCAGLVLAARIVHVQVFEHDRYRAIATAQWESTVSTTAERGNLYDHNGQPLALSVTTYRIGVSGSGVTDPNALAVLLADVLEGDRARIRQKITRAGEDHVVLASDVVLTSRQKSRIAVEGQQAVTVETLHARLYPADGVGASLIGFYRHNHDKDKVVSTGLENSLDRYLAGEQGLARRTRTGDPLTDMGNVDIKMAVHGQSIVLSLDTKLQTICEEELSSSIKKYGAEGGSVLILDPNTGDILAAASFPLMETRKGRHRDPALWVNRNFNSQFEPGSVFKIFSTASLLRNSAIDTATVFNCDNLKLKGLYVYNSGGHDYGNLSLLPAFSQSSNVYWGKAVANLRKSEFYRDLMDFGFGQETSLAYNGQPAGILRPVSSWSLRSMQTIAIGQEIAVTALQLGLAVCSVANGGTLYAPRLIREIRDDKGQVIEKVEPVPLRRVMAAPLAALLREAMGRVVLEGTGHGAGMDWVSTGGKTGTAQKCKDGKGFTPGAYVASFAGMVPLEDPRLVILTVIDEPNYKYHYASASAVPLFASIVKDIRRSTPWLTDAPGGRTSTVTPPDKLEMVAVPDVMHLSATKAEQQLGSAGFRVTGAEKDGVVIQQIPAPGTKCLPGQKVTLAVADPRGEKGADTSLCPDFIGMSNRQITSLAARLGVPVVVTGAGYAVRQSMIPGKAINGNPVAIKMENPWH
jgi:stage V sporulation protein D (sporulation-specific penicillin-binding protein)